ncbi:MAG: acyltransferase [Solirubrobacterales bacterium]|nr:acyltransferase [Solirubrobacterales bacterium]
MTASSTSSAGATTSDRPPAGPTAGARDDALSPALTPPPGNPRFPLFDGLRGITVFAILALHVYEVTGRVGLGILGRMAEVAGFVAVIAFFVISGFLLYRPYVAARVRGGGVPSTRHYMRRRALRILPAYWTALTLLAVFPGLVGVFTGDWWRFYGYLQVYSSRTQTQGIPVAWSLCVEVAFYLALPLWAMAIRRLPTHAGKRGYRAEVFPLVTLAVIGFLIQLLAARRVVPDVLADTLAGQMAWLAMGMMLAVASVAVEDDCWVVAGLQKLARSPLLCWGLAALAVGGLMLLVPPHGLYGLIAGLQSHQSTPTTVLKLALEASTVTLLVLPVVFAGQRPGLPRRLLAAKPIAWIGVISYSFYLWHLPILEFIADPHTRTGTAGLNLLGHLHTAKDLILFVVTLVATAVVAALSYRLVELPFLRLKEGARRR